MGHRNRGNTAQTLVAYSNGTGINTISLATAITEACPGVTPGKTGEGTRPYASSAGIGKGLWKTTG